LLKLVFFEYSIFIPIVLSLLTVWTVFLKLNFVNIKILNKAVDVSYAAYDNKSVSPLVINLLNIYLVGLNILSLVFLKGYATGVWWNHFSLTNLSLNLIVMFYIINIIYLIVSISLLIKKNLYKLDYFFSLVNLSIFLPTILLVNNLFTFFFFLELNAAIVFYKFITTNCWTSTKNQLFYNSNTPKNYVNMLFFQYWSSFFSSVLFVYVIILYLYLYGDVSWFYVNFLNFTLNNNYEYVSYLNLLVVNFIFLFAFFIKIGFTPVHLYKVEIYKGLNYISIFFYTTFYFLIFFTFFMLTLVVYLHSMVYIYWQFFIGFLIVGALYIVNLLFNINLLKNFFVYSTIVNSLGFLSAIISILV